MKSAAFSIVEIVLTVFLFILVTAVILPLNLSDTAQAERIAKWHKVYSDLEYSFQLLTIQEGSIFGENPGQLSEDEQLERIQHYIDIPDKRKIKGLDDYKYKYKNNTFVHKSSKYYFDKFFWLNNNVIAAYKSIFDGGDGSNSPYALLFVDVNGLEKPNKIGLDIFFVNIFNDKITPYGDGYPIGKLSAGCSKIGKGLFCSKYYLVGGNF